MKCDLSTGRVVREQILFVEVKDWGLISKTTLDEA